MEYFRSKSCKDGRMQMETYCCREGRAAPPTNIRYTRSYSANHVTYTHQNQKGREIEMKKSKSNVGSSSVKSWSFGDPELQRKRRVASYKAYAVEGKMKGSIKKSFRWIKETCTNVVYGWW